MTKFLCFLVAGLPLLWIAGLPVNDLARFLALLLIALGIAKPRLRQTPFGESRWMQGLLLGSAVFCVFFTASQPVLEVYLGRHGIDFAIFTQVIDSISRRGAPLSSLIGMEWRNFLSHHFSPFLYIPGLFGFLNIPAYISASLVHAGPMGLQPLSFHQKNSVKKWQLWCPRLTAI